VDNNGVIDIVDVKLIKFGLLKAGVYCPL